mmetsp:Transcript_22493/g.55744  ORF Transcript_22493/g.55744 Transcript_22493/m.55744 type:complete len:239 (+) Transcript_22493:966-1682(+)
MEGMLVWLWSLTMTSPFFPSFTPTSSSPRFFVFGNLPVAYITFPISQSPLVPHPLPAPLVTPPKTHLIRLDHRAVLQRNIQAPIIALRDRRHVGVKAEVHALLDHLVPQEGAAVVVEAPQEEVAAVDLRDVRAVAGEDACELDRDVAAADDDDFFGDLVEVECLVAGHDEVLAFDVWHERPASDGDEDLIRGDFLPVDLDLVLPDDLRAPPNHLHPRARHHPVVDPVQPLDLHVLVRH